jgi:hypothetical protein
MGLITMVNKVKKAGLFKKFLGRAGDLNGIAHFVRFLSISAAAFWKERVFSFDLFSATAMSMRSSFKVLSLMSLIKKDSRAALGSCEKAVINTSAVASEGVIFRPFNAIITIWDTVSSLAAG